MKRKGKVQQTIAIVLAAVMAAMSAGCGSTETQAETAVVRENGTPSTEENTESPAAGQEISFPLEEPIEIEALTMDFNRDKTQYIDQVYEEKTNVKINWTIVPVADWATVLNLKLNSGELPDLILVNKSTVTQFADQGLFVDFAQYLDKMPNLKSWMEKIPAIYNDTVTGNGELYCITTFNTRGQVPRQSIYRKDLFDKEGLAAPETIEELYDDLVILKEKYPDSIPVVSRWGASNLINHLAVLYNTRYGWYLDSDTSAYEYGPATEKFKSAVATLQKFYTAGLIDPEFATVSDDQFSERITSGKALFMFAEYMCCLNTESQGDWIGNGKKNNPDFELAPLFPLATENGKGYIEVQSPTARGGYALAVNAKSQYVDEIIALLDYQLSDEIIDLVNWGVEGETYEIVDGQKQWLIDDAKKKELGLDARSGMWVPIDQDCSDSSLDEEDRKMTMSANEKVSDFAFYDPKTAISFTQEEQDRVSEIMTPINTYTDEELMNFITGKKNMESDWDAFQENLKAMGYEEIKQMYVDKYDALDDDMKGYDTMLGF